MYVTCAALRLARFNVLNDTGSKRHFLGLPVPAAAEVIASTVMLYYFFGGDGPTYRHLIVLVMIYVLAGLMVSNVRYFSFKEVDIHRRQPFWVLLAGILILKLLIAEPQMVLFTGFFLYAASGPVRTAWRWVRRLLRGQPKDDGLTATRAYSSFDKP
mgnify:CR=1 FL=1